MKCMLQSSLAKVFPRTAPDPWKDPRLTVLSNERSAFQLAWFCEEKTPFRVTLRGLPAYTVYQVCLMPSAHPCHADADDGYLSHAPGLYPDLLKPVSLEEYLQGDAGKWNALWFSFEDLPAGEYTVEIQIEESGQTHALSLPLSVLPHKLPPQTVYHTEWFHGDCLADYYGIPVFSEDHWQALDSFLEAASRCGVNMILTPVFTPPLDTAQGGERTTIQLVDVKYSDGIYSFDFEKLRRWIKLSQKHGITEFEISHLFTQWGAAAAPKVMVLEHGELIHKFGWHTPAVGGEYTVFLRQFLSALKTELQSLSLWEHTWFHISDEPSLEQCKNYRDAKNSIRDLLPDGRIIDALSSCQLYRRGTVEKPVVSEDRMQEFVKAGVKSLWTYYCTAQGVTVPNRFFAMPSGRNRILGVLLYIYDAEGFLHWGFNFYNSQYSLTHIDPFRVTDAGGVFPSGDPFLVYPAPDRTAWPSIRSEVLYDAFQDLRLLRLAESHAGRERVLNLIEKAAGSPVSFLNYPTEESFFFRLKADLISLL